MGRLGEALADAAMEAGAEIVCGSAVGEIRSSRGRARGVVLTDGTVMSARAVISTLDIKQTFLALCKGEALPRTIAAGAQAFRTAGGLARILLALSRPPQLANAPREVLRGSIFVAPQPNAIRKAHAAWRAQLIPDTPPIAVRIVSATDPSLAPLSAATMTVTVGCIPHQPLDGEWCFWKRDQLRTNVLMHLERVFPGITQTVMGWEVLAPPDIEEQLGASNGDLAGGEIAADQMFGLRPGFDETAPRTFLRGLYLAGKSVPAGPLATGAAGAIAAHAVLSDLRRR
jgi:phytoene dehydrogenase-like protein